MWCCGDNASGQIGDNYGENTVVAYFTMNIYRKCGKFTKVLDGVEKVFAGGSESFAVKKDGSLWAWGNNDYGDVGNGHPEDIEHTFSFDFYKKIDNDRKVPAGYKEFLVDPVKNYAPVQIQTAITQVFATYRAGLSVAMDGTLYGWGQNEASIYFGNKRGDNNCLDVPTKVTGDVKKILNEKMLMKNNGELWDWETNALI